MMGKFSSILLNFTVFLSGCVTPFVVPANVPPTPANPSGHIQEKENGVYHPELNPVPIKYKEESASVKKKQCIAGVLDPDCEDK